VDDQAHEERQRTIPNGAYTAAMTERGLGAEKLATMDDVDVKTVRRLMSGETGAPHQTTADNLAQALQTTAKALWPDRFAPPTPRSPDSRSATMWDGRADIPKRCGAATSLAVTSTSTSSSTAALL